MKLVFCTDDIFLLIKEKKIIGILSFHVISFLQFGQYDLPETTPLPSGKRKIQTFAKLPHNAPIIVTNIKSTENFD